MGFKLKCGSLFLLIIGLLFPNLGHAIDVEQIFGHGDPEFIRQYNQRLFDWFMGRQLQFQKCLSAKDRQQLLAVLDFWTRWGEKYSKNESVNSEKEKNLLLNFEVFYEQREKGALPLPGLRLRLPPDKLCAFRGHRGGGATWGVELKLDAAFSCQLEVLKLAQEGKVEALLKGNGEKMLLQSMTSGQMGGFSGIVRSAFPIYKNGNLSGELLFLNSYNLLLLDRSFLPIAAAHEKEFHQLALRMQWKSEHEYTVYYP